ncbi:MAG: hypothetical protein DRP93_06110 [Candidatus Neomarinimicrobiota bacterium]|nr:MAG: hypothetical protein DRP93_06110 [Candidatus Neomarinimicrobiota bacterium]
MKVIFIISFILLNQLFAQNTTFSKIYSTELDESLRDVIEDSLGNFYFVGYNASPGNAYTKTNGFILKTNNLGEELNSVTHISADTSIEYYYIFNDGQNHLDVSGCLSTDFIWPHTNSSFTLSKISNQLELVKKKKYVLPQDYGLSYLKTRKAFNNNYLFVSYVWNASNFLLNPVFLRTNENFDSLRLFTNVNYGRAGEDIKQLDENSYWFLSSLGDVQILDSLFIPTGQFSKIPEGLSSAFGIEWDSDTSFYLLGSWDNEGADDIGFVRQLSPLDTNDVTFNTFGFLDTLDYPASFGGLSYQNHDSIFIGGTKDFWIGYYNNWPSWFFVLQTDSMLNIRWERFYGGDAYYVMTKLKATKDGGCIAIGDRYDYKNTTEEERDIYILKLNSEGLLTNTPEKPQIQMHEALVFPNPGTNYLKVRVAAQYPQSTFELYDINGNKILSKSITGKWGRVETTFLPRGSYVYKIYNQKGLYETGKWVKQ